MPILLVLAVAAACSTVPWPDPFDLGPRRSVLLAAIVTLIPILLSAILSIWVVRSVRRDPDSRHAVQTRYGKLRHRRKRGVQRVGFKLKLLRPRTDTSPKLTECRRAA